MNDGGELEFLDLVRPSECLRQPYGLGGIPWSIIGEDPDCGDFRLSNVVHSEGMVR